MDFANERYVRLYTRDTPEELSLEWPARTLWWGLLRKLDRAGVIELGTSGLAGLARLIGCPLEVLEEHLPALVRVGRIQMRGTTLVAPRFLDAQETPQSDAQRKRASRERSRSKALVVTSGHVPSQDVTARAVPAEISAPSAPSPLVSRVVTEGHSRPNQSGPDAAASPSGDLGARSGPSDARARVASAVPSEEPPPAQLPIVPRRKTYGPGAPALPPPTPLRPPLPDVGPIVPEAPLDAPRQRPAAPPAPPAAPPRGGSCSAETAAIHEELARHAVFAQLRLDAIAEALEGRRMVSGVPVDVVVANIADAAAEAGVQAAAGAPLPPTQLASLIRSFGLRPARRGRAQTQETQGQHWKTGTWQEAKPE